MKDKIINFFADVKREMGKVTWPTWDELMESTKIVIILSLVLAVFTWIVDYAVSFVLKAIF